MIVKSSGYSASWHLFATSRAICIWRNIMLMVRTTIYLSDDLKAALAARAQADGRTEADIIREALAEKLKGPGKTAKDMHFGLFASGITSTSTEVDDVLTATGFGTT